LKYVPYKYGDSIKKPTKYSFQKGEKREAVREYNRLGELAPNILYAYMEL
jgi:hypothetical protein